VTIDDSPWAWELLQRAGDQALINPGEAARQLESVLEAHASQLVPWPLDDELAAGTQRYRSARAAANELLRAHPLLLERWRSLAGPAARRRLDEGDMEAAVRHALLTSAGFEAALRLAQSDVEAGRFAAARRRLDELREHPDRRVLDRLGDARPGAPAEGSKERTLALHALILEGLASAGQWSSGQRDAPAASGAAEQLRSEQSSAEAAAAALRAAGGALGAAGAAAIERLMAAAPPSAGPVALTPLDRAAPLAADQPPSTPWQLLASLPLPDTLAQRATRGDERLVRSAPGGPIEARGALLAAAPTVIGGTVVVNEGGVVRAFDRLGGRPRWTRELVPSPQDAEGAFPVDLSVVVPAGDVLLTLAGHATASGRVGGEQLLCLDAESGEVRWRRQLGASALGGEDEGLFPLGVPVVVDSTVCLFLRKVTGRLETMTYVVGLSLDDGSTRWIRHHSSSAGIRLGGQRPITTIAARDGLLYAGAASGAVACLDPRDGEFLWLRRFPVPIRDALYDAQPWEIGGAAPGSELVVFVEPEQTGVSILDRRDGSTVMRRPLGPEEQWGEPRYILTLEEDSDAGLPELLVAVGSDVAVFDTRNLATPLWRLSQRLSGPTDGRDDRLDVRGRVQVAGRALLIPRSSGVLLADADSGVLRPLVEGTPPGVAVLAEEQLLQVTADQLVISMPFDAAERILRQRLAEQPEDPDRALSLLSLGVRARSLALSVEAAEAALTAIDQQPGDDGGGRMAHFREELVGLLLAADRQGLGSAGEDGLALHDLLERAARSPRQRGLQKLARADWLVGTGQLDQAVALWQSMLADEALSAALLPVDDSWRASAPAAGAVSAARESRPAEGPQEDGPEVMTDRSAELPAGGPSEPPQRDVWRSAEGVVLARMALWRTRTPALAEVMESAARGALAAVDVSADPLRAIDLASRHPGTGAAAGALAEAASALIAAGRGREAMRAASRGWRAWLIGDPPPYGAGGAATALPAGQEEFLLPLLEQLVAAAQAAGAPERAANLLTSVERRLGGGELWAQHAEGATRAAQKLASLRGALEGDDAHSQRSARLGELSGEAVERPGRLLRTVAPPGAPAPRPPADAALIYHDGAVRRIDGSMAEVWAIPFEDPDPQLLEASGRRVVLWSTHSGDPQVALIDPREGQLLWTSAPASTLLPPAPALALGDIRLPLGGIFDPAEILPLLSGDRLVLARRSGDLCAMQLSAGPEAVWSRRTSLVRVHGAWSDDATVLIGGVDDRGRACVAALDAMSGREVACWRPELGTEVRWVMGTPDGRAVVATDVGLEAFDIDRVFLVSEPEQADAERHQAGKGAAEQGEPVVAAASGGLHDPPPMLWRTEATSAQRTGGAWMIGGWLLVADSVEGISSFDLDHGRLESERFGSSMDLAGADRLRAVMVDEQGVSLLFQERLVAYGFDGAVVGRDAAAEFRDYRAAAAAEDRLLLISAETPEQIETPVGRRTQYLYRIYGLDRSRGHRLTGPALQVASLGQRVERVGTVDGSLLLSTDSSIIWVPMSAP
jgi:outer membrane protein assembly factor BamB